jgi:uncharacterized protein YfbU (UPF0304 family)
VPDLDVFHWTEAWRKEMPTVIEKLTIAMLCDLHKKLGVESRYDLDLVTQAVDDDDLWILRWAYNEFNEIDNPEEVVFVGNVFDMFSFIERGYAALSPDDKAKVDQSSDHVAAWLTFSGYDGNNESRYLGIADTLVNRLDRFTNFKDVADKNSHCPMVDLYGRMYAAFEPIRKNVIMREMTADEIIQVVSEAVHPENR